MEYSLYIEISEEGLPIHQMQERISYAKSSGLKDITIYPQIGGIIVKGILEVAGSNKRAFLSLKNNKIPIKTI